MSTKKITYDNKVGVIPKTIRINQVWDDDMNHIKDVVNTNADQLAQNTNDIANITGNPVTAANVSAVAHLEYLLGSNVQLQLDQTETAIISTVKTNKRDDKNMYQTGINRVDLDTSVVSITSPSSLQVTNVNNIMFVNDINIDTNANRESNFIKSFGNIIFDVDDVNTPLPVNTRGIFYAGIDTTGTQVYRIAKFYDQDICYLVRMIVANTAGVYSIVSFKYMPDLSQNKVNNRDRLVLFSGSIAPSGAASISFANRSMSYGRNSINYDTNKLDPNYLTVPDSVNPTPMAFLLMKPNVTSLAVAIATQTVLNPTQWFTSTGATGGTAVAATNYQVYKVWLTVTKTIIIQTIASTSNAPQLGVNAIFANRDDALAGLESVNFPIMLPAGDAVGIGTFYLRAGTNVNGSGMMDPNDFFFKGYITSSSTSLTGVTNHDALSGKNDNPNFQHATTTQIGQWNTAYAERNQWNGGATGLVAATGRTSLGANAIGSNIFTSPNPSAITFLRANADNSVSWLDAATFRTAIGAGTGTVGGAGSTNYIPKWSSASALGLSQIFDNGTSIGIGTITPQAGTKITIQGVAPNGVIYVEMPMVNNAPSGTGAVPDAFRLNMNGHNGTSTTSVAGFYTTFQGNKNIAFYAHNHSSLADVTDSVAFQAAFKDITTGNIAFKAMKGSNLVYQMTEEGLTFFNNSVGIGVLDPIGKLNINTGSVPSSNVLAQANGTISFCNTTATTNFVPTIIGKSSNGIGLELVSASWDTNPNPDMFFIAKDGATDGDFTLFTNPAFRFTRFSSTLFDIIRDGRVESLGSILTRTNGFLANKGTHGTSVTPVYQNLISLNEPTKGAGIQVGNSFASNNGTYLRFVVNNTTASSPINAMDIVQNGSIGIGTSNPTLGKVQIKGTGQMFVLQGSTDVAESQYMAFYDSVSTRRAYIGYGSATVNNFYINNDEANAHISIMTNGTGNVGIGTINPSSARLQVEGTINDAIIAKNLTSTGVSSINATSNDGAYGLGIGTCNTAFITSISFGSAGDTYIRASLNSKDLNIVNTSSTDGSIKILTSLSGVTTEKMRILANGNIGIGISAPTNKFQVQLEPGFSYSMNNLPVGNIGFVNAAAGSLPMIVSKSDTTTGLYLLAGTDDTNIAGDMRFNVRSNTGDAVNFTDLTKIAFTFGMNQTALVSILRNGNVGIGVSPSTYGFISGSKILEVQNTSTAANSQAHSILSSAATTFSGSVGTYAWAMPGISHAEKRVGYIAMTLDTGFTSASPKTMMTFYTHSGTALSEAMRVTPDNNLAIGITNAAAITSRLAIRGSFTIDSNLDSAAARPAVGAGTMSYGEIRGYGINSPLLDSGFLRLSAGGGTQGNVKSYIDLSGQSNTADMQQNIVFGTSGTERMRLLGGGNFGVGIAAPTARLHTFTNVANTQAFIAKGRACGHTTVQQFFDNAPIRIGDDFCTIVYGGDNSSGQNDLQFTNSTGAGVVTNTRINRYGGQITMGPGGAVLALQVNGNLQYTGTSSQGSDSRIKENIKSLENGLETVLKLRPCTFDRTDSDRKGDLGFIAQEIEKVLPQLIYTTQYQGFSDFKTVDYISIIPILTKAIQELKQEIFQLKQNLN